MITAHDFAGPIPGRSYDDDHFAFGLAKDRVVEELRRLADRIAAGQVLPQKVTVVSKADVRDFTMTRVSLQVAEQKLKKLYAPGEPFPIAIASSSPVTGVPEQRVAPDSDVSEESRTQSPEQPSEGRDGSALGGEGGSV